MGFNRAILQGNVGQDPDIRSTNSGDRIASFSLATTEKWKDKTSGECMQRTEWHRITVFNQGLVKVVESYVKKGTALMLEGEIRTRKYTDKEAVERYSTEIVLPSFGGTLVLLGQPTGGARSEGDYGTTSTRGPADTGTAAAGQGAKTSFTRDLDDEVPF